MEVRAFLDGRKMHILGVKNGRILPCEQEPASLKNLKNTEVLFRFEGKSSRKVLVSLLI